jgi:hypothetical protein
MAADRKRDLRHDATEVPAVAEDNDLAASTFDLLAWLRPHLQTIGIALALVAGGMAAWTLVKAQREATAERSWDECMAALAEQNPDRLAEVIRRYPGSPAARWSQMLLAEAAITEGSQQLFGDRERGRQRLSNAVDLYTAVLAERPGGLIGERAVFGLAKAREALGELDLAKRGYESLVKDYPASAVRGLAEQRIRALSRPATSGWYDWFAAQKMGPPPAAPDSLGTSPGPAADAAAPNPSAVPPAPATSTEPAPATPAAPETAPRESAPAAAPAEPAAGGGTAEPAAAPAG